jgi:uncharacterized protein (TIGR00369 family)
MTAFEPHDPNFEARVRTSFARQRMMQTIGAKLASVLPGAVEIELPFRDDLTQQHGFLHAGVVATIGDNACGYAALSLTPADAAVLTVEYKINLVSPARGQRLIALGHVTKPGRTISVCAADVFGLSEGNDKKLVASMLSTIMILRHREDLTD